MRGLRMAPLSLLCVLTPGIAAAQNNVGILASASGCPPGTSGPYTSFIDNEDTNNANTRGGWLGASVSDRNTTLKVCSAPSSLFSSVTQPYMLLRWVACPSGTTWVMRYVDSEDGNPVSYSDIPDGIELPSKNIKLHFCLYPAVSGSTASFPALGWDYGIFAAPGFPGALQSGFIGMDDDDGLSNDNYWCDSTSPCSSVGYGRNYYDIVSGGLNTHLSLARISGAICGNGLCTAGESCSTCVADCGSCSVCGDSLCSGAENCYSCPNDCGECGICGDGICSGGESCSSCCSDCGPCSPGEICTQD